VATAHLFLTAVLPPTATTTTMLFEEKKWPPSALEMKRPPSANHRGEGVVATNLRRFLRQFAPHLSRSLGNNTLGLRRPLCLMLVCAIERVRRFFHVETHLLLYLQVCQSSPLPKPDTSFLLTG
jgi:hypothetical protein